MKSRHDWLAKFSGSENGFTLPEIMITVGIVGLLAAVATSNYQKFSARARQTEAKANLTGIYTAETNYAVDARTYTNCLVDIGVSGAGPHNYGCGFAPYTPGNLACGPGGGFQCNYYAYDEGQPVTPACLSTSGSAHQVPIQETVAAGNPGGGLVTNANYGALNDNLPGAGYATITGVTNNSFIAACAGNISTSGYDNWVIDNTQNLTNIRSGI